MSLKLIGFSWQLLTSPLGPNISPSFERVEPGDQEKPRWCLMALMMTSISNESIIAWSFSSVAYYFLDHLNVIKEGTIF